MLNFIDRLQRKPLHVRKQIAFFASVALTGVIVLFWLGTIVAREPEPVRIADADTETGPAAAFGEHINAFWGDTKEVFSKATALFSVFKEASNETSRESSSEQSDETR